MQNRELERDWSILKQAREIDNKEQTARKRRGNFRTRSKPLEET